MSSRLSVHLFFVIASADRGIRGHRDITINHGLRQLVCLPYVGFGSIVLKKSLVARDEIR
jgi:hypothetical protein